MINGIVKRFFPTPEGSSLDGAISFDGMGWNWALGLLVVLGVAVIWAYRWGAPALSAGRRQMLAGLQIVLITLFLFLLVKPVLMLTLNEPIREKLLVLVDTSQSFLIQDRRREKDDEIRSALAAGLVDPSAGLEQTLPPDATDWRDVSRAKLLEALASNDRLALWPRLQDKADLFFYAFGQDLRTIGGIAPESGADDRITTKQATEFFSTIAFDGQLTALGDSLRQALDQNRGQPVSGVLVLTDGANNAGEAPEEAAQMARQAGLPLYLYGIGITTPKDIVVRELSGARGAFVKERAEFTVFVRGSGFRDRTARLLLKADGEIVDEQEIALTDSEAEHRLGYSPTVKGEAVLEAIIEPLDEESASDNNVATTRVRVLDSRIKVLYLEGEPRWDFRYLLSTLDSDRRLEVKCVLFDGDGDLGTERNTPFLEEFPTDRADVVANEIIILGDVDPMVLGTTRMNLIKDWVSDMGGGLIFLAGPKFNPIAYAGTPLEALLPVELRPNITPEQWGERNRHPVRLKLTATGERSPLLRLSDTPLENRQIWNEFPGVRWTAQVARARPTAQVFLVDPTPERASADGPMPIIAQQPYGQGMVMYFGVDETYRWRSKKGEELYSRIWNQVIQNFSLERQLGASARTQLRVEKPEYLADEKVVISGKLYTENFTPVVEASIPGTLTRLSSDGAGDPEESEQRLLADPNRPGEYVLEFSPSETGEYRFSTLMDPQAIVKFEVLSPRIEQTETALDANLLRAMAEVSGGKFLREEDLNGLPELVASRSITSPTFRRIVLYQSIWWMVALMVVAITEWFLRRLWQLK